MDLPSQSLADLEWPLLLQTLAALCHSESGQERARQLPLLEAPDEIEQLLELVAQARQLHDEDEPPPFDEVPQLDKPLRRLAKDGTLDGPALLRIARTLHSARRVARFLSSRRERTPDLAALAERIEALDHVWQPILDAFEPDGELSDNASPELGQLRRRVSRLQRQITDRMKALLDKPSIAKYLQDTFYTQREERYVLPVRTDAGPAVPGIVHGCSSSGATMFVEPQQVIGLNNELKVAQVDVEREVLRILADLSGLVAAEMEAIEGNLGTIVELDLVNARARLALELRATRPLISSNGEMRLHGLRHPLMQLATERIVPHDVALGPAQSLVISGPNAGGKTVCLKSIGLCALMLRAGMHLPTDSDSSMPVYRRILCDIGDDQSIARNLSSFSGQMRRLLGFLELADGATLVLLDEVVSGTDPNEGAALAQALLEAFVERDTQLIATTHYDRLKTLALTDPRFLNASVGFDVARLSPTFELFQGSPGSSFALPVARQLGLPEPVTERARKLAGEQQSDATDLLQELTQQRSALRDAQREAEAARARAAALEQQWHERLEQLEARSKVAIDREHAAALDELKRARADLRQLRISLRRAERLDDSRAIEAEISAAGRRVLAHAPERESPPGRPAREEDLVVGACVWVPALAGEAEILESPRRDRVTVRFGGLRTSVAVDELLVPSGANIGAPASHQSKKEAARSKQAETRRADSPADATKQGSRVERTIDNTIDLRGMRVDEALRETDAFIDQAILRGYDVVFVLHGHGSGALRGAIRANLELSPSVERLRAATEPEGGDALTVVWIR
jgi:DNA mismatch repair protein MutS2